MTPSFAGIHSPSGKKFCHINYRSLLVAAHSKNFAILACTVMIRLQNVTDGQTDGHFDDS